MPVIDCKLPPRNVAEVKKLVHQGPPLVNPSKLTKRRENNPDDRNLG
jgi:hypothetical protein